MVNNYYFTQSQIKQIEQIGKAECKAESIHISDTAEYDYIQLQVMADMDRSITVTIKCDSCNRIIKSTPFKVLKSIWHTLCVNFRDSEILLSGNKVSSISRYCSIECQVIDAI